MSTYPKLGAAALAMLAIAAVAVLQHNSTTPARSAANAGGPPSMAPTSASATPAATPAGPPALTQVFVSDVYGLSISYPASWTATAGRTPWTMDHGTYREPLGDLIVDPSHQFLWLKLASQPIGDTSFDAWSAEVIAGHECQGVPRRAVVGGVQGLVTDTCAVVAGGGRGYLIAAHFCPCELGSLLDWSVWFRGVVDTVQLEPAKAVDAK